MIAAMLREPEDNGIPISAANEYIRRRQAERIAEGEVKKALANGGFWYGIIT